MRSWTAAPVPRLPGQGLPLRLYDTASDQVRPVAAGRAASMYVCGITPYDATHIGHAATYVAFDLVHRVWLDAGHDVRYVQNVTDVDDPLLERAAASGEDWADLADRETELFREDMEALRVLPPGAYVGAVEAIPQIGERIRELRDRGATYELDGDIYFSVSSDARFGSVSNLDAAAMLTLFRDRGGDPDRPGKKDALDPVVWRAERPGEPAWESPLGRGRPGWHVECTTIAIDELGMGFDVQGGGSDLIFPHHEMSASHGTVLTGQWAFARTYAHAGLVGLGGAKMSKSRGNLVFVSQLRRDGHDPMALRLALLAHHYRSDWDWTPTALADAVQRLARWRDAVSSDSGPAADDLVTDVRRYLADDLDAPAALTAVDRWCERARLRGGSVPVAPALVAATVDALLGISL